MNSLGKRSVSITEIDWEPCENMLKTSKSKKIFSRPKGGKLGQSLLGTKLVSLCQLCCYQLLPPTSFMSCSDPPFVADCDTPAPRCCALIHHLLLTVTHQLHAAPCCCALIHHLLLTVTHQLHAAPCCCALIHHLIRYKLQT